VIIFNDSAYHRDRDDKDNKDDDHNNAIVKSDFDDSDDDSKKEILQGLILDNLFHKYYHFLCTTDVIPMTIETKINIRLT
jgi:hypothetical protein